MNPEIKQHYDKARELCRQAENAPFQDLQQTFLAAAQVQATLALVLCTHSGTRP
jgi:hypothetical protein